MPPRPPVLPIDLSITWPIVYFTTRPSSLNLMEHACGGVENDFPVGALPRKPAPESLPVACDVNHTRPVQRISPEMVKSWVQVWECLLDVKATDGLQELLLPQPVRTTDEGAHEAKPSDSNSGFSTPCP